MTDTVSKPPFTYNIGDFMSDEIDIETDLIPEYQDETAAEAAGHVPGDVFKRPGGKLGVVGLLPPDGRE